MQTRAADGGGKVLAGHFAVFNQPYNVCKRWVETIAPGAFSNWLASGRDTKVLWNHNPDIVLGSTENRTAALREDETGLWGSVDINAADQDAVNAHARVDRGDVRGGSFGFNIVRQEEWWEDDIYHTKVLEVELYEVSPCTFPAYPQTDISARAAADQQTAETILTNKWRERMTARLKGAK